MMFFAHNVSPGEIGIIRIYVKPGDKIGRSGARSPWSAKPLYREPVARAKVDGIMNAVAHHTHYGFSNHGSIRENGSEISDPHLTMCVELIGHRGEIERFCRRHGELLSDKVIVYKHLEHWRIGPAGLDHSEAVPIELAGDTE